MVIEDKVISDKKLVEILHNITLVSFLSSALC